MAAALMNNWMADYDKLQNFVDGRRAAAVLPLSIAAGPDRLPKGDPFSEKLAGQCLAATGGGPEGFLSGSRAITPRPTWTTSS
jgi:hypothetical protein